ncbi:hypothetical protein GCM10027347_24960 [Larkinella harenae]
MAFIGMVAVYSWFDPARVSFFPPCPFRLLTGLECPGCGSQRCLHQLLHGHIRKAYAYNPLLVLSIPYVLLGLWLEYNPFGRKHQPVKHWFYGKTASLIVFGIVILYWIGRNIH